MSIRGWIASKLFDIPSQIERSVDSMIEQTFTYKIPGMEQTQNLLLQFRQSENYLWARNNPMEKSKFYSIYKILPGEIESSSRQLFWEWASPIDNIPKLSYPTPNIIMGQMKSLLFSEEITIDVKTGSKVRDKEINEELENIHLDNNLYELLQNGSNMETYSGTLGARFIVNTEYEEYPIIKYYPAERIKFKTYMGRVQEIIFLDNYIHNKKTLTLRSIYGKGYIRYELVDHKGKEQPLDLIEETKDLKDVVFLGPDGLPINILMATYKKNRSNSDEFPDTPYGGSDFEGLIDTFQMIDEMYSTKLSYVRRTRATQTLSEDRLKWNEDTKKYIIPKEYEMDTIVLAASKTDGDSGFKRDIPTVDFKPYTDAINDELKSVWMKIGMAYTSVGLEAHSANISNAALLTKEKSTVVVRSNKEKLWKQFLKEQSRLVLIYNSLKSLPNPTSSDSGLVYKLDNLFDYEYTISFPAYSEQSFDEKLDSVIKGLSAAAFDYQTAIERLFGEDLTEEEKLEVLYRTKLENNISILEEEYPEGIEPQEIPETPAEDELDSKEEESDDEKKEKEE